MVKTNLHFSSYRHFKSKKRHLNVVWNEEDFLQILDDLKILRAQELLSSAGRYLLNEIEEAESTARRPYK